MVGSVLSQPAQFFGFPQVSNFDIVVMTKGTRYVLTTDATRRKNVFCFPPDTHGEEVQSAPNVSFVGIYFGIDYDEVKKIAAQNPGQAVAYIPDDPDVASQRMFSDSAHTYSNKAQIVIPVAASMTRDDMRAVEYNLQCARHWYLLSTPGGMAEEKIREGAETYIGADPSFSAYGKLLSQSSDERSIKLAELKARLIARRQAKEYLTVAHEIYAQSNPSEPVGSRTSVWQPKLPKLSPRTLAA